MLQQGRRAVEDYVTDFGRWSVDTQWNNAALRHHFCLGLSESLKNGLSWVGVPNTLEVLITLVIQIDPRLWEHGVEQSTQQPRPAWMMPRIQVPAHVAPTSPIPAGPVPVNFVLDTPEPMQLRLMRPSLISEERLRWQQNDHYVRSCPENLSISPSRYPSSNATHLALSMSFRLPEGTVPVTTIIDSGACSCFIELTFAAQHIPLWPKAQGLSIFLADGSRIISSVVTQETPPLPVVTITDDKELFGVWMSFLPPCLQLS